MAELKQGGYRVILGGAVDCRSTVACRPKRVEKGRD